MKKIFVIILVVFLGLGMMVFLVPTALTQQAATPTTNQQPGIITNVTSQSTTTQPLTPQ